MVPPHSTTYDPPRSERLVRKYRELLQAKLDERVDRSNPFLSSERGFSYVRVLPDGTEIYGYVPGGLS